jgi:queuine tRNA-ribosyltransferase
MAWPHPILTDSGGFQVLSLKSLGRVTEDGVWFKSHLDGSSHFLSPERAIEVQLALGADIIMTLDECVAYPASREAVQRAVKLTGRWARRAKERLSALGFQPTTSGWTGGWELGARETPSAPNPRPSASEAQLSTQSKITNHESPIPGPQHPAPSPSLFGIVQGGVDKHLRRESVEALLELEFEGYALGGLSVGEPKAEMYEVAEFTAQLLPRDRPRYLMGVGTPEDLVECVARGIDMFDCVMPTRNARNGSAFTSQGKVIIRNTKYARDESPLDSACKCPVCQRYPRSYIRHLFVAGEMLGAILTTHHNLHFYIDRMRKIRQSLLFGAFAEFHSRARAEP